MSRQPPRASRRGFLAAAAGLVAVVGPGASARSAVTASSGAMPPAAGAAEPFWGAHQGGILTPAQRYTYFAAFDLVTAGRRDVAQLLQAWTAAAARLAEGKPAQPLAAPLELAAATGDAAAKADDSYEPTPRATMVADTGEVLDLSPERLTVTFGFGPGLFVRNGKDRFGIAAQRPAAFVDLPKFTGDQLVDAHTGGDLSVQACADDPQVAFHAIRQLARIADGAAKIRWTQTGFVPARAGNATGRNLMGFKDGTVNPAVGDPQAMAQFVWVGDEAPAWMRGGSYMVARRIRIALEHWDRMQLAFQEQAVGRHKYSGAPIGAKHELEALDLDAKDKDGNPLIAENAHVRLAAAATNEGAQILRRPYSYNDGVDFTAERWPPWRQGLEYDAGLFFICYQRDPRTGFIKIFERMAKLDLMNQFVTHVGSGLFACPRGAMAGEFIGQRLFA